MPTHTVVQGDHISRIALKNKYSDFLIIWDHANNAALKAKRPNPHVLHPGDSVFVPDKTPFKETKPTTATHRYKIEAPKLLVKLEIHNFDNDPAASTPTKFKVEAADTPITTGASGVVRKRVLRSDTEGHLKVESLGIDVPIKIGYLDPVEEVSGQQGRLNNLGYFAGTVGTIEKEIFQSAVEEFQCDNEMTVTGVCDADTQAKLKEVHKS